MLEALLKFHVVAQFPLHRLRVCRLWTGSESPRHPPHLSGCSCIWRFSTTFSFSWLTWAPTAAGEYDIKTFSIVLVDLWLFYFLPDCGTSIFSTASIIYQPNLHYYLLLFLKEHYFIIIILKLITLKCVFTKISLFNFTGSSFSKIHVAANC